MVWAGAEEPGVASALRPVNNVPVVDSGTAFGPNESEEEPLDITAYFEDLGPGDKSHGWPDDYVGPEIQTVLQTLEKGCRAGKSYCPDPSGRRRAVKAADYKAGTKFFATNQIIEGLEDLYWWSLPQILPRFSSAGCWRNGRALGAALNVRASTGTKPSAGLSASTATPAGYRCAVAPRILWRELRLPIVILGRPHERR